MSTGSGPYGIQVFTRPGSAVGEETTPGDWTSLGTFAGADSDFDTPELLTLSAPLSMSASENRAFYVVGTLGGLQWIDSSCCEVFSNADLTLTTRSGTNSLFADIDNFRQFAGSVHYDIVGSEAPEPTTVLLFASGVVTLGVLSVRRRLLR